jgi:L-seryl-tRNA(Ser) seleniumtransferase
MAAEPERVQAEALRALPQVQRLLETPEAQALIAAFSHGPVTAALRQALEAARAAYLGGNAPGALPSPVELVARAAAALEAGRQPVLRRVINGTGILLHTNLGRAPLAAAAIEAIAQVAVGYSNLEFDLAQGKRGARMQGVEDILCRLTGAEAALVVNNNAAAVLLALSATARDGEVIVSRGELVEIGGGFRIPDVIRQGGARLVEVGTTNKTRVADYRDAITPDTRALLKVHQSNFRIEGFTSAASLGELAALACEAGKILIEDLGSGTLVDLQVFGRPYEPTVQDSISAGADIVTFSGDKLLGGPQAGIIVGRARALEPLRRHPLLRALRADKFSLAALEATLRLLQNPVAMVEKIPVLRMLAQRPAELQTRAESLCRLLAGVADCRIEISDGFSGGGSLPTDRIASRAVSLAMEKHPAEELARRLRLHRPAIVGRIAAGRFFLDMLTIADAEITEIADALRGLG